MTLEEMTLTLFAVCNGARIVAYLPQLLKAATDKNGASSISLMTWFLFGIANLSTVAYALVNQSDWWLAACFAGNALCCVAIVLITSWKRRSHALHARPAEESFYPGAADLGRSYRLVEGNPEGRLTPIESVART
jgi:uncharacterized protein with PQ loop repeat